MKFSSSSFFLVLVGSTTAFQTPLNPSSATTTLHQSISTDAATNNIDGTKDPLLIRAARGETVERTPVWMM